MSPSHTGTADTAGKGGNPLISELQLKQLYTAMLNGRELRKRIGHSSGTHAANHEAALAAATLALGKGDRLVTRAADTIAPYLYAAHRNKGLPSPRTEQRRPHQTSWQANKSPVATASTPVGQLAVAIGLAVASKLQKKSTVVLALVSGDSTAAHWIDALEAATAEQLPLVCILAAGPVRDITPSTASVPVFESHPRGFPIIPVAASDAVAMFRVIQESIQRTRFQGGPTLILAAKRPFARQSQDCIETMEEYLERRGLPAVEWKRESSETLDRKWQDLVNKKTP